MNDKAQTIFRVEKNKDNPFVMIDRRAIENPKLSWKAKGLLAYLLSRPDDWIVRFRDLAKRAPDGAHTIRMAMKELRAAGHVEVITEREGGRVVRWVYKIHEAPDGGFQQVEIQEVEKPQVEKRAFNKNKSTKNKETKKESTNTELKNSEIPINKAHLDLFKNKLGKFHGEKELYRWAILCDSIGPEKASEIVDWAHKNEIHLSNRPKLLNSLETAAKKWSSKPGKKQTAAQSGDYKRYNQGEYAEFIA